MFSNFGVWQILLIVFVLLLLFGIGRLPEVGRGLGKAIKEFRNSATDESPKSKKASSTVKSKTTSSRSKTSSN